MIGKNIFCKNKHHFDVVYVPSFHISARSSSFFHEFLLYLYGKPFYGSPDNYVSLISALILAVLVTRVHFNDSPVSPKTRTRCQ